MPASSNASILIIDDDEAMAEAIETRLTSLGYRCAIAHSGGQGVALFQQDEIALVITDVNMPEGDGIATARALRRMADTPIVFITAFREEYRERLMSIGNASILAKPFTTPDLVAIVETELQLHEATRR